MGMMHFRKSNTMTGIDPTAHIDGKRVSLHTGEGMRNDTSIAPTNNTKSQNRSEKH